MDILIRTLADGNGKVLAGALTGRRTFAALVDQTTAEPVAPEPVYLNFTGVEVATASFLREAVIAFRDRVRHRRSTLYPVIANANELVIDELSVLLSPRGDVLMLCNLDENGAPQTPRLLGTLDSKQRFTFELVREKEETTAAELHKDYTDEGIEQTAWNNRLASLAALGLIVEHSEGRSKHYRPLLKGVKHGT